MLALAQALRGKGHTVTICAPESYRALCMKSGLQMISSGKSFEQFLEGEGEERDFHKTLSVEIPLQFVAMRDALREADVLIGSPLQLAGPSVSKQLALPYFCVVHSPIFLDQNEYPCWGARIPSGRGWLALGRKNQRKKNWERLIAGALNRERKYSGLSPVHDLYQYIFHSGHLLVAVDPGLAPMQSGANTTVTGFWWMDQRSDPDAELEDFMSSGPPPVFIEPLLKIGAGALDLIKQNCAILAKEGHRVVVGPGVSALQQADLPAECRLIESIPDSNLLSHVPAVIHSGDSWIVAAAARAGVPQVVVPRTLDQLYWAERIHAVEAGPPPVRKLEGLGAAVQRAISDSVYRQCAQALAARMQDRLDAAADLIFTLSERIGKTAIT
jgi:UDP:flavonoid glycosyltransferase YjiC (YdhE family)